MPALSKEDQMRIVGMVGLNSYSHEYIADWVKSIGRTVLEVVVLRATHGNDAFEAAFIGHQDAELNPFFGLFAKAA